MKLPRVLLLLAAATLLPGCSATSGYTTFRSSNLRGEVISEWIARGPYYRVTPGYRITAVERVSGPTYPVASRYPYGWKTTVTGPLIEHWRTGKPAWLDSEQASTRSDIVFNPGK